MVIGREKGNEMSDYVDGRLVARKHAKLIFDLATCDDLAKYNQILSGEVPDEVLMVEVARLYYVCDRAANDYFYEAEKGQGDFVRMGSLPFVVQEYNPVAPELQHYYEETCILMGHVDEELRETLKVSRMEIASACQLVYDEIIYSR